MDWVDLVLLVRIYHVAALCHTHLGLHLHQQVLAMFCALCIMPTCIQVFDDVHFLPQVIPPRLNQHDAQPSKVVRSRQAVQVEMEESAKEIILRDRTREIV
jgi:hypothetical protein